MERQFLVLHNFILFLFLYLGLNTYLTDLCNSKFLYSSHFLYILVVFDFSISFKPSECPKYFHHCGPALKSNLYFETSEAYLLA